MPWSVSTPDPPAAPSRAAEAESRQELLELLAAVVAADCDAVALACLEGAGGLRIVYANQAFCELSGAQGGAVLGESPWPLLAHTGLASHRTTIKESLAGSSALSLELKCRSLGERWRDIQFTLAPLSQTPGAVAHWSLVLRDVSLRPGAEQRPDGSRKALAAMAGRTNRLKATHERVRRRDRLATIGTMAAGLGHELNNLLLPMQGHLDCLDASSLGEESSAHVRSLRVSLEYLSRLTDHLRLLALDPDDSAASTAHTRIADLWRALKPLLNNAFPARIELTIDLSDDLPPVAVPRHGLIQAILNLLINAREAIRGVGAILLWARASDDARFVRLGVSDTGRGMTRKVREHALDPFFTTKKRGLGTGLGLSLVSGVARAAGGSVEIESAPRRGTVVIMNLPVAGAPPALARPRGSASRKPVAALSLSDQRVAACLTTLLSSAGYAVREAPAGGPTSADLWVTEPSPRALRRARSLRRSGASTVVVYGADAPGWPEIGAEIVDPAGGLDAIRAALSRVAARGSGP